MSGFNNEALKGFWDDDESHTEETVEEATQAEEPYRASLAKRDSIADDISTSDDAGETAFDIDDLLRAMLKAGASDLHLSARLAPMIRVSGDLRPIEGLPVLNGPDIMALLKPLLSERQSADFQKNNELDLAYEIPGLSRFRVNLLKQRKQVGAVIRGIPNKIKSTEELGLPEELNKLAYLPRGLVLVTGPTGSGKSTTLAAIIDKANRSRHDHIITVEDPIEFAHDNKNCIVTQREIGVDTDSFSNALRAALREDPDIILIGEMRDLETISAAITAAETGHLVFGTLHTQSSAETISRIIDVFPEGSKEQVRQQLGSTVQGIVCQTLVKTMDGGRAAATEYMKGTSAIKNLIRKGFIDQIPSYIETGQKDGMHTLNQDLKQLVLAGKVRIDTAAEKSTNYDEFLRQFGTPEQVQAIRRAEDEKIQGSRGPRF